MTEKRFVEIDDGLDFSIKDIESEEVFYDCESVVDILNEFYKKNKELKFQLEECRTNKLFSRRELEKQNKELRSDRDYWKTLAQSLARTNGNVELKDEHLAWKRVDVE